MLVVEDDKVRYYEEMPVDYVHDTESGTMQTLLYAGRQRRLRWELKLRFA
jgi:hypothetical protein